jgi:pyruvate kinase
LQQIQKILILEGQKVGKKVITATQMLESMIKNPRPTRAETNDVANAVYDGTSAVMLSGETAAGKYPVESLTTMIKVVMEAEKNINYIKRFEENRYKVSQANISYAISHAACTTAHDLGVSAIIAVTQTGFTARTISSFRPLPTIVATVTSEKVRRQLAMSWGVYPIVIEKKKTSDELYDHAVKRTLESKYVKNGDLVVITGSSHVGISGTTNTLKVHLVGDILVGGRGINHINTSGKALVAKTEEEALRNYKNEDILVIPQTSNAIISLIKNLKGLVVEQEGASSHAAIVGLTLDIPVIYGAKGATDKIKSGSTITIDSSGGAVYSGVAKIKQDVADQIV